MNKKQFRSSLLLLLTAVIWGVAFVAQSAGMEHVGPFTFNATRSIIGGLVLLPVIFVMDRKKSGEEKAAEKANGRILLLGGICCGVALAVGKYIGFVDGDDTICKDMYNEMMVVAMREKTEVVERQV